MQHRKVAACKRHVAQRTHISTSRYDTTAHHEYMPVARCPDTSTGRKTFRQQPTCKPNGLYCYSCTPAHLQRDLIPLFIAAAAGLGARKGELRIQLCLVPGWQHVLKLRILLLHGIKSGALW